MSSECLHTYQRRVFGGGPKWDAYPSEMKTWYAHPLWWRLLHRKDAPWNR